MFKSTFIFLLFMLNLWQAQSQTINIAGPAGSGQFGKTVTALPNGNYVVTDPLYDDGAIADVGAVYLYNGSTHALISTLKGSTTNDLYDLAITGLSNGNFLVRSPYWDNGMATDAGAVTWCNANTGISGVVSSSNSLVGNSTGDFSNYSVTMLNNGNYLVSFPNWDNGSAADAGAITWGSATSGVSGAISSSNSLVGNSTGDFSNYSVTMLNNGNYLVITPNWDNGSAADAGSITWGNATSGASGVISSSSSLVGSSTGDFSNCAVTILNNGNYVVLNKYWDNGVAIDAGAVTWGNGSVGVSGVISSVNSLIGNTAGDQVGYGITPLINDNFVVRSPGWDNGAVANVGAATCFNGNLGLVGAISSSNSLVGSSINDSVGGRGITALSNGNYVVCSSGWDNGTISNVGAATWGNGNSGITGEISNTNSLVGITTNDYVGVSATALTNGNYVVCSPNWDGIFVNLGAATWGDGITGTMGAISNSNSLTGSTTDDYVGSSVTALSNGNYVVISSRWRNVPAGYAGAATWGNGTVGQTGFVSNTNSLVGGGINEHVGDGGITALNNGNYVVRSPGWNRDAGAVTWGNGYVGVSGVISSSNSLVGEGFYRVGEIITVLSNSNYLVIIPRWSRAAHDAGAVIWCNGTTGIYGGALEGSRNFDFIGDGGIYPLSNGNYVVVSLHWDNGTVVDAGAVTFGNGMSGVSGGISSSNSFIGSHLVTVLSSGNYIVQSPGWSDNYEYYPATGAVAWGNGLTGITGTASSSNSLIGSTNGDGVGGVTVVSNGSYYVVSSPFWDNGVITDAGAITLGNSDGGVTGVITSCNSFTGSTAGGGFSLNFAFDDFYDYLIVGRPVDNIVSIYELTNQALANSLDTASIYTVGNIATPLITNTGCRIIATITPDIYYGLNGIVNAKVWIEDTVPTQSGKPFVARHYEITPVSSPITATEVTLYFAQQEFDDFNAHVASTLDLPTGDNDAAGKANLRIGKYPGISNNGTGLPGTYSGTPQIIDPDDAKIVWNSSLNRWEVSFLAWNFSGFIVQTDETILPLTLLEFSARLVNNNGLLTWKTTDEVNTLSFDIERSIDGRTYVKIGDISSVNQPGIHLYNYTDNNITSLAVPVVYYRLKQKDIDGRFTYSRIVALLLDNGKNSVMFYPNPVSNEANLVITADKPGRVQGRIIDNMGRVIRQLQWSLAAGSTSLSVDVSKLANGMYYLELKGENMNQRTRFVKQ